MEEDKSQPTQNSSGNTPARNGKSSVYSKTFREKKKRELEELKKELKRVKADNQKKEMELIQCKSKIQQLENINQQRYDTNQDLIAEEARMRQITLEWEVNRQYLTFEQLQEWCLSQTYGQDCHVSGTSGTVLPQVVNGVVGLGAFGTSDNFPPSMADHSQQMGFDQLNGTGINLGASTSAGPSYVANHDFPFGFDASNTCGVWINSTAVEHNLPELAATNSVDSHFNDDLGAGILTNDADAPSSGAYPNLDNDGDLFTSGAAPGINLGASTSAGPSGANHDVPFGSDASNSHGVWIDSTVVEDNFPDLAVSNNVENLFNDDLGDGILPNFEAGPSSFGAYPNLENDCDLSLMALLQDFELCTTYLQDSIP